MSIVHEACAFIQTHYREPKTNDPVDRLLAHPEVARSICGALYAHGIGRQNLEDMLQDVYVKALTAFREEGKPVPADLRAMKAYCAEIAKNHALNARRDAARHARRIVGTCDADEHTPLEYGAERREKIDVKRHLGVLAQLFREGAMPERGFEILEARAAKWKYKRIAQELGISEGLARWRMNEMRRIYREKMVKLGLLPAPVPLELVVSNPEDRALLKEAA